MDWQHIFKAGENETVEFKSSFNNEVIETIVAFANAKGGQLFIGLSDEGTVRGVKIQPESIQKWINEIKTKTAPSIIPDAEIIEINEKTIVVLSINEYPIKPVSFKGRYYKRIKNANHLLSVNEISNLHTQSIQSSWDAFPHPLATLEDLDFIKVSQFIEKVNNGGRFSLPNNAIDALNKLKLIQNHKPVHAALLLFAKNNFNHNIHVGRFKTPTMILDDKMLKGDLFSLVEDTIRYIIGQIKVAFEISGQTSQRTEIFEYPIPAIRELVMNAIVHRDYMSPIDIQIKIFDQSITIFNPGKLFWNLTVEDLKTDHYQSNTRNKLIAEAFYLTKDIEKYGSGFIRVRKEIRTYPTMHYEYNEIANGFLVELRYEKQKVVEKVVEKVVGKLTENQASIIKLIENNAHISAKEIAIIINMSARKVQENIAKLKALGILERIGAAKGGYWQIINKNDE